MHQLVNKINFDKGKNIYLNACLLPKVPYKEHLSKIVSLATPGILHGSEVSFVSHNAFAVIGALLIGNRYLMGSIREID